MQTTGNEREPARTTRATVKRKKRTSRLNANVCSMLCERQHQFFVTRWPMPGHGRWQLTLASAPLTCRKILTANSISI